MNDTDVLYNTIKEKAKEFTKEELTELIISEGLSKKIAKDIIKKLEKEKVIFKKTSKKSFIETLKSKISFKKKSKTKISDKERILKELAKDVKIPKNEKPEQKEINLEQKKETKQEKDLTKKKETNEDKDLTKIKISKPETVKPSKPEKEKVTKQKQSPLSYIVIFLKKFYYFFEDFYYSIIDKISKVIPINKLTDKIDNYFPSFILFLIVFFGLIALIFLGAGSLNLGSNAMIDVTVIDTTNSLISNATVILSINDNNLSQTTDAFGNAVFEDIKFSKKDEALIFVSKESYNPKSKELKPNKIIVETITLDIDTKTEMFLTQEQTKEILFKENNLLITKLLQVKFLCSNSGKTPSPSVSNVTTGKISVILPAGCGVLRVDVTSDHYNQIQNQIVPEDNVVLLTLKSQANVGKIESFVKDVLGNAVSGATVSLYKADDSTTVIDESNLLFMSGVTDIYGRYVFDNLKPGSYTLSSTKEGYVSSQRSSEYFVLTNNTTTVNMLIFSSQDLQNIDCTNQIFSLFCKNGCLDCNNLVLSNYYLRDQDGNLIKENNCCKIGKLGYLGVKLVDINGIDREIKGDISIFRKTKTNSYQLLETKRDVNSYVFYVPLDSYKIVVTNTEEYGYFPSTPVDVNEIDRNITISLEYSSSLNTGEIGVNVTRNNYNYAGAIVYLYNVEDTDFPLSFKTTNSDGDVNFPMIRSNKKYFAFSFANNYQGHSEEKTLNSNSFLKLDISLNEQSKILNLNVNVRDYTIEFYSLTKKKITDYTINSISDTNKEYVFQCEENEIFAIISAENKSTFQTNIINLVPGQKVYYKVALDNSRTNAYSNLELLGIYDETGTTKLDVINFSEHRNKVLKLKYKLTTTNKENRALAYALIKVGNHLTLSSDFLILENVFSPNTTFTRGCNFHSLQDDWDESHFVEHYETDHSQNNCSNETGYKWVKINFTSLDAEQIEFSVDFRFKNGITQLENYAIYSKALTKAKDETYALFPTINSTWDNCNIRPQGYFYSPLTKYSLLFSNSNYNLIYNLYDANRNHLEPTGSSYELKINHNYFSSQNFLYLKSSNPIINKDINAYSTGTKNNLIYNSYAFKLNNESVINNKISVPTYKIESISVQMGSEFDHNSSFTPNNFFENNAKLVTNFLDMENENPVFKNILSYYDDSNIFLEILTQSLNNDVLIGDNNITFRVRNKIGEPLSGVVVKYHIVPNAEIILGETNALGFLENVSLSFPINFLGKNIFFKFSNFSENHGLQNNAITLTRTLKSGYSLAHENASVLSSTNPLIYLIGKYKINNEEQTTSYKKNYYILKNNINLPVLDISLSAANYVNIQDTNSYLYEKNYLPTQIADNNKLVETQLFLLNVPSFQETNVGTYHNFIEVGAFDNDLVILDLNADFKIQNSFDISLDINVENKTLPGLAITNNTPTLEFIKNINTDIDFNYIVKNTSNKSINLDFNVLENISGIDVVFTPQNTTLLVNETKKINVKYIVNNDTLSSAYTQSILFKFTIDGFTLIKDFNTNVVVHELSDIFKIKLNNSVSNWNQPLSCSKSDCFFNIVNSIENNTNTYDLNLFNISFIDNDGNFNIQTTLPKIITAQQDLEQSTKVTGNYNSLDISEEDIFYTNFSKNKVLNFKLKIKDTDNIIDVNKNIVIDITLIKQTINEMLEEYGLYSNLCLGFGSSNTQNIDIIGTCDLNTSNNCKTGETEKPNILMDWSSTVDWSFKCIDSSSTSYNTNKTHCDSAQMMFSVFSLIHNDLSSLKNEEKAIYLMADGVSKSFLKDLINYRSFLDALNYQGSNNILNLEKIDNNNFTLEKYEMVQGIKQYTTKPGKYKIKINRDFSTIEPKPLHIELELINEMPYSMRNLLYYIPIDGSLGVNTTTKLTERDGYGSSLINSDSNLLIVENNSSQLYLFDTNTEYNSFVKINLDQPSALNKTLNSEGKLLNIKLDDLSEQSLLLTIDLTPSYPIPLYAKVVDSNVFGLSYKLKYFESNYQLPVSSMIKWNDYENTNLILKDDSFFSSTNIYINSQVLASKFKQHYGNNINKVLLKTILYWPIFEKTKFSNLFLSLGEDLDNPEGTKIYSLYNLDVNGSKQSGFFTNLSKIKNYSSINSYTDIFNLVYSENSNVCMESGLTGITVRWINENIDFTDDEKQKIISDFRTGETNSENETLK